MNIPRASWFSTAIDFRIDTNLPLHDSYLFDHISAEQTPSHSEHMLESTQNSLFIFVVVFCPILADTQTKKNLFWLTSGKSSETLLTNDGKRLSSDVAKTE